MSAAFDHDFIEPSDEQLVCEGCGRALLSVEKRFGGKVLCDGCDSAINGDEEDLDETDHSGIWST